MRKIFLFVALAAMAFVGCSKEEDPEPAPVTIINPIEEEISALKIKPSNQKDITYIGFVADSITYKLVSGMMKNNAWIAKFDSNGNEIFSCVFKDTFDGLENSYIVRAGLCIIDENLIIFNLIITNNPNTPPFDPFGNSMYYRYASRLHVIDFNSGKELHKFSFHKGGEDYNIIKTQFSYLIESNNQRDNVVIPNTGNPTLYYFSSVSLDGKKFWEREWNEYEKGRISNYNHCTFLDLENIFYEKGYQGSQYSYTYISHYRSFRSINLKEYKLNYDFEIVLRDDDGSYGVCELKNISVLDNLIIIEFDEQSEEKVIDDPISGASHTEYTLLNKYLYEIDKRTGEIINHKIIHSHPDITPSN